MGPEVWWETFLMPTHTLPLAFTIWWSTTTCSVGSGCMSTIAASGPIMSRACGTTFPIKTGLSSPWWDHPTLVKITPPKKTNRKNKNIKRISYWWKEFAKEFSFHKVLLHLKKIDMLIIQSVTLLCLTSWFEYCNWKEIYLPFSW